jgi:hypothetical protein
MLWQCFYTFGIGGISVVIPIVVVRIFGPKNYNAILALINGLIVMGKKFYNLNLIVSLNF